MHEHRIAMAWPIALPCDFTTVHISQKMWKKYDCIVQLANSRMANLCALFVHVEIQAGQKDLGESLCKHRPPNHSLVDSDDWKEG